jgi:hypothetical protein
VRARGLKGGESHFGNARNHDVIMYVGAAVPAPTALVPEVQLASWGSVKCLSAYSVSEPCSLARVQ